MKVDWRTHPNNIGHFHTPGCFRCHDGQHVGADGKVIPKGCNTCHTVQAQLESGTPLIRHKERHSIQAPIGHRGYQVGPAAIATLAAWDLKHRTKLRSS